MKSINILGIYGNSDRKIIEQSIGGMGTITQDINGKITLIYDKKLSYIKCACYSTYGSSASCYILFRPSDYDKHYDLLGIYRYNLYTFSEPAEEYYNKWFDLDEDSFYGYTKLL